MNADTLLNSLSRLEGAPQAHAEGRFSATVHRDDFAPVVTALHTEAGLPLDLLFATDDRFTGEGFGVHAILGVDASHEWIQISTSVPVHRPIVQSLTRTVMAAHWYERYAQDMFGIRADGHPDPRRLVHHENVPANTFPLRKDFPWDTQMPWAREPYPMGRVEGEGIFGIPVGPIHAGIIEPGHFRFNVAGERIITLEGKLFFTHKGVEKLLEGRSASDAMPFIERVSGDAAASHALAFCQAVEAIAGCAVPPRARRLRAMVVELERITMHIHDLANICGMGTGFTLMAANGFRIKEQMQRLSSRLFGNRFFRGFIVPGGVSKDLSAAELQNLRGIVDAVHGEMARLMKLGLESDTLRDRLETTGVLDREAAWAYGAKGVGARASGLVRDSRHDHPHAAYGEWAFAPRSREEGDVYARVMVRVDELTDARSLVHQAVAACLRDGNGHDEARYHVPCEPAEGDALGWSESWRGQILDWVRMREGVIDRAVVRDPSFCNWPLFGELGPGNIVPDFPLCNKSLNLSYSGTDL